MKVNIIGRGENIDFYRKSKINNDSAATQYKHAYKDSVQISDKGKNLNKFLNDIPVEQDDSKVKSIQEKIKNGVYEIDPKLIAQKIVDTMKNRTA